MLEMAVKNQMSELTAMGMLYVESSKIFPSFAVKPTNKFNFDRESDELRKWIEHTLQSIPPEIKSLYFTQGEDKLHKDEDLTTYSISLLGGDSYDEYFDWISDAKELTEKNFQSETLDGLFQFKDGLSWDFKRIAFLENIILYGYCMLLLVKACKAIDPKKLCNHNIKLNVVYGVTTGSELVPYQALELTDLL